MKKVYLITVPGTGTRFTRNFLIDVLGYSIVHKHLFPTAPENSGFFAHSESSYFDEVYSMFTSGEARVVSTLRDPYMAFLSGGPQEMQSAMKRPPIGGKLAKGKDMRQIRFWSGLIAAWERLDADGESIAFMNIEEQNEGKRVTMLQTIADHLEATPVPGAIATLAKEWPVIGKSVVPQDDRSEYIAKGTIKGQVPTFLDFATTFVGARSG